MNYDLDYSFDSKDDLKILKLVFYLENAYVFRTLNDMREIYYYDKTKGIFLNNGETVIEHELELMDPSITTRKVNEVKNHIIRRTFTDRKEFDQNIEWMTFQNFTINLKTLKIKKHNSAFMHTNYIPVKYKHIKNPILSFYELIEDLLSSKILNFMHQIMSSDDVNTVLDFFAYCLWRGTPFHKLLICVGNGRNGKSLLMQILTKFLGNENVATQNIHELTSDRFSKAELYNKLVNIDADVSKDTIKNTDIIKKLTGGDQISGQKKFGHPFKFCNYAKLILLANKFPTIDEETDAMSSRLLVVEFPNQFLEDTADPFLLEKLTTKDELSILLRILLKRLPRVLKTGIQYNKSFVEIYHKYIDKIDSITDFIYSVIELDPNQTISKKEVYENYKKYCKGNENELKTIESEQSFSREMSKHAFLAKQVRVNDEDKREYHWIGIKLKNNNYS